MAKRKPPLSYIHESLRGLAEPIESLKPDPRNAREHGDENLAAIEASLKRFGQRKPIVANRTSGHIEAGNGLLLAASRLKWTHVAVVWVEDDAAAETGFALADNRSAELAGWDQATLQVLLSELHGTDEDLYDALRFEDLAVAIDEGLADVDLPADEPPAAGATTPAQYAVIVEFDNPDEQESLYERLAGEGLNCRKVES